MYKTRSCWSSLNRHVYEIVVKLKWCLNDFDPNISETYEYHSHIGLTFSCLQG